ncbi:MAG: hypothetical protein EXR98_22940 [Gemmataceae bacterium]|nr:hypothetical protein [Gemmataceae bacterium]
MRLRSCSWIAVSKLLLGSVLFVAGAVPLLSQAPTFPRPNQPAAGTRKDVVIDVAAPPFTDWPTLLAQNVPQPKKTDDKIDTAPKESPQPEADAVKSEGDLVVPLGEVVKLRADSGLAIKEAYADREKVVKVFAFEKKAQSVKAIGVGLGVARVTIVDVNGKTRVQKIRVTPSLEFLQLLVDRHFPQSSLKLHAVADNVIFVEGEVDSPAHVEAVKEFLELCTNRGRVVSHVRLGGVQQVQLQIWIARVDRGALRKLNVNVLAVTNSKWFLGSQLGSLMGVPAIAGRTVANPVLTSDSSTFFGVTNDTSAIFGFFDILKQQGVVKVLANPMLVTTNGRPAEFLVGGEQPIPTVVFAGGTAQPNVQFKPFGTRLAFVPTLLGDGKIRLDVLPEVSTVNAGAGINSGGVSVPQFVTQRLHTTVEMESGQTLYLGGLLQNEVTSDVQKFPVLGDLPYIGVAFRKVVHQVRETELVVVVTPRLIEPLRASQRPALLPGQESRNPTDFELYLEGRIEKGAKPPLLSDHLKRWNYSPPTNVIPASAPVDPSPGPVFGPFGPSTQKPTADPSPGPVFGPFGPTTRKPAEPPRPDPGDREEQEAPPVGPIGSGGFAPRQAESRSPATNVGFVMNGRTNSPLADFLLPPVELFWRSLTAGR